MEVAMGEAPCLDDKVQNLLLPARVVDCSWRFAVSKVFNHNQPIFPAPSIKCGTERIGARNLVEEFCSGPVIE